ncbi:MAG TPA: hypothetical protein VN923_02155, partial [Thermoanaerobaculia bacterium]|nr:hypothetical protein [Thermoanaerobaculia bacterium]
MQHRRSRTRLALTGSILAVLTALPASVALARSDVVDVELRELPAEDAWQASFHLPAKAAGVDFVHGRGNYRRASWSVAPAGSQWTDASDSPEVERLCFPRPTRELGVSFRSDFARR